MNCQQFQKLYTLDPSNQNPAIGQHLKVCKACAIFVKENQQFEQALHQAIKINIPPNLNQRILSRQKKSLSTRTFWHFWLPIYGVVFSLVFVITLLLLINGGGQERKNSLSQQVITYLKNEPHVTLTQGEVPETELQGMFEAIGGKLQGKIGQVTFCRLLTVKNYPAAHIVLKGRQGPVNVLFIRNRQKIERQSLKTLQFTGLLLPKSWGHIAIVGQQQEPLNQIIAEIDQAVSWSS